MFQVLKGKLENRSVVMHLAKGSVSVFVVLHSKILFFLLTNADTVPLYEEC